MAALPVDFVSGFDGVRLAVRRMGNGPVVLMLHGLFSSADVNWIKFGAAARIAEAGYEVIMPDLRAHGTSDTPQNPAAYPPDVLVRDVRAIIEALKLDKFDLVGFSLGARTAVSAVLSGVRPRRLVLAGMGVEGLSNWEKRSAFFIDAIDRFDEIKRGDRAYMARAFMKTQNVNRVAARLLLHSVQDIRSDSLSGITMPTLVLCGVDDHDNGSAADLAALLPNARHVQIPGTHMSSVTMPEFGAEIARFITE